MMSHAEARRARRMDLIKCHRERSAAIPYGNGLSFLLPEITTSACGLLVMTATFGVFSREKRGDARKRESVFAPVESENE